jgi:TnsA endonuclease N terminal
VCDSVQVSVRAADGRSTDGLRWSRISAEQLTSASPWRTFRWYKGQRHFPGSYWSATMSDLVIYESRLELARLLYADFDQSVRSISAQPFLLKAQITGQVRRHIPDFLLVTDAGPVVVDVKPAQYLGKKKIAFTLAWCRAVVEDRGWEYEVWSEPPEAELANLRMLAGYRRKWLFDRSLLDALIEADLDGVRLHDVPAAVVGWPRRLVWAHLLHLIWSHAYTVDLNTVLSGDHMISRTAQ